MHPTPLRVARDRPDFEQQVSAQKFSRPIKAARVMRKPLGGAPSLLLSGISNWFYELQHSEIVRLPRFEEGRSCHDNDNSVCFSVASAVSSRCSSFSWLPGDSASLIL
jgi:hypothetical protein